MLYRTIALACLCIVSSTTIASARTWSDKSGAFKVEADLIAKNKDTVVVKTASGKLLMLEIEHLSDTDREFLEDKEASDDRLAEADKGHVWHLTIKDFKMVGSLVGYYAEDYVLERKDSRVSVNGMRERDLPEAFVKILPAIVNHFEKTDLTDVNGLIRWLEKHNKTQHKYHVEGVGIQLESGDLVRVPIFLFVEPEQEFLRPGLDRWRAYQSEDVENSQREEAERREKMLMAASARAYQRNQAIQTQAEVLQLGMLAVATGATELWQVGLAPRNAYGQAMTVIVPARDSLTAEKQALARYPGARVTAVRKYAGY